MKIMVTGAQGYIGSIVSDRLAELGIDVSTVDPGWFRGACVSRPAQAVANLPDFRAVQGAELTGVDAIIHLAGYSNDPMGWLSPQDTHDLNEFAAIAFARKARQFGVRRFVFSSTCSVYGESGATELDETGPTRPLTPYAAAKLATEKALVALQDKSFRVAVLRGATAFGASPVPRTDLMLNELCAETACGRPIRLLSDGTSWRPFMPVDDFAKALVAAALDHPRCDLNAPIWNIAPPTMQMTVKEAAGRAATIGGAPQTGHGAPPDRRSYRVNGRRFLKAFPAYSYSEDFEHHVAKTVSAFKSIPTLEADLNSDRFIRLAAFMRAGQHQTT